MNDSDWVKEVKGITDPIDMLAIIVENQDYLGFDPYYADLHKVMIDQAEKIVLLHNKV
jgi:hypothetical protein